MIKVTSKNHTQPANLLQKPAKGQFKTGEVQGGLQGILQGKPVGKIRVSRRGSEAVDRKFCRESSVSQRTLDGFKRTFKRAFKAN
jgi:hypothetical protein